MCDLRDHDAPVLPVERRTPACSHRRPKAIEAYWADRPGRSLRTSASPAPTRPQPAIRDHRAAALTPGDTGRPGARISRATHLRPTFFPSIARRSAWMRGAPYTSSEVVWCRWIGPARPSRRWSGLLGGGRHRGRPDAPRYGSTARRTRTPWRAPPVTVPRAPVPPSAGGIAADSCSAQWTPSGNQGYPEVRSPPNRADFTRRADPPDHARGRGRIVTDDGPVILTLP